MKNHITVFTTVSSKEEAKKISWGLVEKKTSLLRQYYPLYPVDLLLGWKIMRRRRTSSHNQNQRRKIFCLKRLDT